MGLRCKKGDLALCTKGGSAGLIVEVLEYHGKYTSRVGNQYENIWIVSVHGETMDAEGIRFGEDDSNLVPIRPDELKEEEEKEATV